jgi:hypothetical protein
MSEKERAATLVHDVAKYVARIALNVPEGGSVPAALVPLLVRDLYELPSGGRASERFDELASSLAPDARLREARAELEAIDRIETAVRAAEDQACREACTHARRVAALLRAYAAEPR